MSATLNLLGREHAHSLKLIDARMVDRSAPLFAEQIREELQSLRGYVYELARTGGALSLLMASYWISQKV